MTETEVAVTELAAIAQTRLFNAGLLSSIAMFNGVKSRLFFEHRAALKK
ncbi:MAG TPA: hypothetical protein V6C57_18000 [Coleofasciculaceae cyanobacterium]